MKLLNTKRFLSLPLLLCIAITSQAQLPERKRVQRKIPALSREVLTDIIWSIPGPLELSVFAKNEKLHYQPFVAKSALRATPKNGFEQAWLMGVYFAGFAQACIYKKSKDARAYLKPMQQLVTKLKADKFFKADEFQALIGKPKRYEALLDKITQSYEGISNHWIKLNYPDLSIVMASGSFVESLYLLASPKYRIYKQAYWDRLGEQKITLEMHLLLLSFYEHQPEVKKVLLKLNELQKIYDQVKIDFIYQKPKLDFSKDIIEVQGKTLARIQIDKATKQKLLKLINQLRAQLISLN